jgi:TPR repeat protein
MRFLSLFLSLLMLPALAFAGPYEDGIAAMGRRDYQMALKLLQPLADHGNADAAYRIGFIYYSRRDGKRDLKEAEKWYLKAAEQGNMLAEYNLGLMYANGPNGWGVKQDNAEAMKWWRKAAEQGNGSAQIQLAQTYQNGDRVKQDNAEAYFWWSIAAPDGVEVAAVAKNLSAEQKATVNKRIKEWQPVPVQAEPPSKP